MQRQVKFASENAAKKKLEKTLEVEKAAHKATEKTVAAAKAAKEEAEKKLAAEQKSAAARADQLDALHKKEVQLLEKQVRVACCGGSVLRGSGQSGLSDHAALPSLALRKSQKYPSIKHGYSITCATFCPCATGH